MKRFRTYRETSHTIMTDNADSMVRRISDEAHVLCLGSNIKAARGKRDSSLLPEINDSFLSNEDVDFIESVNPVNRKVNWVSAEDMKAYENNLVATFVQQSADAELDKANAICVLKAYHTGQRLLGVVLHLHEVFTYYHIHSIGRQAYWQVLATQARNYELLGQYQEAKQFWCRLLCHLNEDALYLPYQEHCEVGLLNIDLFTACIASLARIERRLHAYDKSLILLSLLSKLQPGIVDETILPPRSKLSKINSVAPAQIKLDTIAQDAYSLLSKHANPHWWDEHYVTPIGDADRVV